MFPDVVVFNPGEISRIDLLGDTEGEFHLYMSPTVTSDSGEYSCLYKTRCVQWAELVVADNQLFTTMQKVLQSRESECFSCTNLCFPVFPYESDESNDLNEVIKQDFCPVTAAAKIHL